MKDNLSLQQALRELTGDPLTLSRMMEVSTVILEHMERNDGQLWGQIQRYAIALCGILAMFIVPLYLSCRVYWLKKKIQTQAEIIEKHKRDFQSLRGENATLRNQVRGRATCDEGTQVKMGGSWPLDRISGNLYIRPVRQVRNQPVSVGTIF